MSLKRWNARRDQNEKAIVGALRAAGAQVAHLSEKGLADLLVVYRGKLFMLEVKTKLGRATKAQEARSRSGWPVSTVRDEIAALSAIGAVRVNGREKPQHEKI